MQDGVSYFISSEILDPEFVASHTTENKSLIDTIKVDTVTTSLHVFQFDSPMFCFLTTVVFICILTNRVFCEFYILCIP